MKKTIISVLCVLLLFIPTYIAIASYVQTQNAPISNSFVEKIDIADLDGESYTVAKTNSEGDLVSFFVSMNSNATKVAELPEPLVGTSFYKVTFHSGNVAEEYKYYLNTKGALSYSEFPDGTVYQLSVDDVNKFLKTPYALSLFSDDSLPILKSTKGESITPTSVSWNYKLDGEKYSPLSGFKTTEELVTYEMEGGLNLDFTAKADLYTLKVYDKNSTVIYDGSTDDLGTLSFDTDSDLTFMVKASWYEDNTRDFYGEATYNFRTKLIAGAEFFIGESEGVQPGDFVAITGYNISDPAKVRFTSSPSIGYTPTFYAEGDHVIAFVPLHYELAHGSYVFTLSYGSVSQEINLEVASKKFRTNTHKVSKVIAENTRNEESLAEFDELFASICAQSESVRYFTESFTDYEGQKSMKAKITAGFGLYRTVSSTKEEYRNIGVEWKIDKGTNIPASNAGKIVYAGISTYGGRMVVIDHGMGLKTWYLHLDEIKTNVGDIVALGDIIGTAGNSGFAEQNGICTIMTVGNIPVCPYRTWDSGVGIGIYSK